MQIHDTMIPDDALDGSIRVPALFGKLLILYHSKHLAAHKSRISYQTACSTPSCRWQFRATTVSTPAGAVERLLVDVTASIHEGYDFLIHRGDSAWGFPYAKPAVGRRTIAKRAFVRAILSSELQEISGMIQSLEHHCYSHLWGPRQP